MPRAPAANLKMPVASLDSLEQAESFARFLSLKRSEIDGPLEELLNKKKREAILVAPGSSPLFDVLSSFVASGGKRLRPILVLETYAALGGTNPDRALPAALATELLHTYLLIHDDIMDHAALRRGQPTAHIAFEALHRRHGLEGDGEDFGRTAAILAGDLACSIAQELFSQAVVAPELRRRLDGIWAAMGQEVILGQYLEILASRSPRPTAEELTRILHLKSGRYSMERPIELGAVFAGAGEGQRRSLSILGRALGEAFQLRDDLLGLFGEEGQTGKPVGGDLLEGKYTFLLHLAFERLSEADQREIARLRGAGQAPAAELETALAKVVASGAPERVQAMIAAHLEVAQQALTGLELTESGLAFFRGLIRFSAERQR
ncbi:MAG TPA: polyprenyl synthetase family protein [Thermoanaerobaculia bacterium]|nr:polyprenyl synthetase family protein [Thermoanaerobaculia bacterium]